MTIKRVINGIIPQEYSSPRVRELTEKFHKRRESKRKNAQFRKSLASFNTVKRQQGVQRKLQAQREADARRIERNDRRREAHRRG